MRQLVGAGVELRVGEAGVLEHHRGGVRASGPPGRRTAPAASRPATGRAVSFHSRRMVWRSAGAENVEACRSGGRAPQPPPRAAGPAAPPSPRRSRDRTGRWRTRARPRSPPACRPRPRCSARLTDRSNLAARVATGSNALVQPRQLEPRRGVVLEREHHLEQRMARQRARRVELLDQPLERQVLVGVGAEVASPAPGRAARGRSDCRAGRCAAPAC